MTTARPVPPRKLPRGSHALDPETVARDQRRRLQEGIVHVAATRGYANITVNDVSLAASVSRNTFHQRFDDLQACLLAAWEATVAEAIEAAQGLQAARQAPPDSVRGALQRVLRALTTAVIARPDHARLVIVEVLSIGGQGPVYRRRLARHLEALLTEEVQAVTAPQTLSASSLTIIANGVLQVFDHRLRTGRVRQLRVLADDLAAWGASYETTTPLAGHRALGESRAAPLGPQSPRLPHGHKRLPRSFVDRYQRKRILRAVVILMAAHGYAGVTVPSIVATARISTRTFYENFSDKHEAFLATYDDAFARLFEASWAAAALQRDGWPASVRDGVSAWIDHQAADPLTARFVLNDVLTVGPVAADKIDESFRAFAQLLDHGYDHLATDKPPAITSYAVIAGVAGLACDWVLAGRSHALHELAPDLCYAALAPFVGDESARIAAEQIKAA
jgi:AcrR family transcriptional regulator